MAKLAKLTGITLNAKMEAEESEISKKVHEHIRHSFIVLFFSRLYCWKQQLQHPAGRPSFQSRNTFGLIYEF